jgi:murein DD-endopeptidase MepM/ murein hydrolase activator NlpD
MALLVPFPFRLTQRWGIPAAGSASVEPPGWAMLQRFWWNKPALPGSWTYYRHFHPGLDLGAAEGTPILASETGMVTAAGWNGVSGLRIQVTIRPGTTYVHGHLSRLGAGIGVGVKVKRGQVIGYVGHTGGATGPHSHFGVQSVVPGTHQSIIYDPTLFLPGGANQSDPRILPYY